MRPTGLPKTGGRKKNSTNLISKGLKERLSNYCEKNFSRFEKDLNLIEKPEDRCKLYLDMCKMIVPKPSSVEDQNKQNDFRKEFLERMFNHRE